MKKIVLLFLAATTFFACKPTEVKTDSTSAANGTVTATGPDVDMLKKSLTAFANGDWTSLASFYADTAVSAHNIWAASTDTTKVVKMTTMIENFKKQRELIDGNLNIGGTIFEVVTMPNGNKYGHCWAELSWKTKKGAEGKTVVFNSFGINKDGKITYEWPIYDTKDVAKLGQ